MTRAARNAAVLFVGLSGLAFILFYATTVDVREPRVTSFALSHHLVAAQRVALTHTSIEVVFSEPVERPTAERAFTISPQVDGTFSWTGSTMSFTPHERLPLDTRFQVRVLRGVQDAAGNRMNGDSEVFSFDTVGRPRVVASGPADGGEVAVDSAVVLTFSTLMDTASVERALQISPQVRYTPRWSGEVLTIEPAEPLAVGQQYRLQVATTATDLAGNSLSEPFVVSFSTLDDALETAWILPADGLAGVSPVSPIAIAFDEPIDPESLDGALQLEPDVAGSITLVDPERAVTGSRDAGQNIVRFEPASPLAPNTTFQVELSGVRGADGSTLPEPLAWSFTTGVAPSSLQNQVLFLSDRAGVRNLWAMNPDGSNQHQVSAELAPVVDYAVSPDGGRFVVADGIRLVEQEADGGDRRVLTDDRFIEYDPAYRPDGDEIVFGRADAVTGAGLGIWTRATGGGEAREVDFVAPGELDRRAHLQRAPRYSPDGTAIAFVDEGGHGRIVELATGERTEFPFVAVAPPAWGASSTHALFAGAHPRDAPAPRRHPAGRPVAPLTARAGVEPDEVSMVRLSPGALAARPTPFGPGATAPTVGPDGTVVYLRLDSALPEGAGSVWWARLGQGQGAPVETSPQLLASTVAPAPEAGRLVIGRVHATERAPGGEPGGVWVVDVAGGTARRLAGDGERPVWLP